MRTTLDLSDPLFRQLKARAALRGMTLKDLLTQIIEAALEEPEQPAPRKRSPLPVTRRLGEGPPIPYRTNAELNAILDDEGAKNTLGVYETGRSS